MWRNFGNNFLRPWFLAGNFWILIFVSLAGCIQVATVNQPTTQNNNAPTVSFTAQDFLTRLAETVNPQTARIELPALSGLGFHLTEAETEAASFTKVNTYPKSQNGIVAFSYGREAAQVGRQPGIQERLFITLQPMLLCIDVASVQAAWQSRRQAGHFAEIGFGAGQLSAADGLHKDKAEQNRRGNGPIEMIIEVTSPKPLTHQTAFRFDHQYHRCARSVTLTTRQEVR
jgi:hypothetical protein